MEQATVVTQLEHIHILPIYAYGIAEDKYAYIATRLTERKLSDLLYERIPSLNKTAFILSQITAGLDYAAERGVNHGSINPGNVYLDHLENAYIDDYEISRIGQSARTYDQLLLILGTPLYASPEQLRFQPVDRRSDIYSMGAIVYRMVTGVPPFELTNGGIPELVQKHEQKALIPPRRHKPDLPSAVEDVILRAMHENPDQRFETAIAFAEAFEAAIKQPRPAREGFVSSSSTAQPEPLITQSITLPIWVVAAGAILLVLLLIALLLVSQG
jgi:serine/threonine-protein kinase